MNGIERDFADALAGSGLQAWGALDIRADGRVHRFRLVSDKPGKRNGWYVLSSANGAAPHGHGGDWKTGSRLDWIATEIDGRRVNQGDYEAARRRFADEQQAAHARAGAKASALWARLAPAASDHPYLKKKQIGPGPCRLNSYGRLVVPVFDAGTDELISLQFITDDGAKMFLGGSRTKRGHLRLGLLTGATRIIICEGYATGATLFGACGDPVIVAFNAGNLAEVGRAIRSRHTNASIVFAADNDEQTVGNPGVSKAMEAAFDIGGLVAVPPRPGDYNDLAADYGTDAVRLSIDALTSPDAKAELDILIGPVQEADEPALMRLARLPALQYDRVRAAESKKLGIKLSTLDAEVKKRRERKKQNTGAPPPPQKTLSDYEQAAYDIVTSHTVLDLFAEEIGKRLAGEVMNAKRLYLVATSRLFEKTMHAAIKGSSASGKSELRLEVLAFIPPEHVISFTTLSEKALLYMESDFAHKILSMGEATGIEEQKLQDYLLRELMSEGVLRYPVPQKVDGQIVTITIVKSGPVVFVMTTTRVSVHEENETRLISLETDDSEDQTRAVLYKVAEIEGGDGGQQILLAKWHDYQRWLAMGKRRVVVPWARTLATLIKAKKAVRLRRDFGQLLRAIKAHALLHRYHRERDDMDRIVATIDYPDDGEAGARKVLGDYEAIRDLFGDVMAEGVEIMISETVAATVKAVAGLQPDPPKKDLSGNILTTEGATVDRVAGLLEVDRSVARRRLRKAEDKGLIVNLEKNPKPARPSYYRTLPASAEALGDFLPTAEALGKAYVEGEGRK